MEPSSARSAPQRPAVPGRARLCPAVPALCLSARPAVPPGWCRCQRAPRTFSSPPPASNPPFPPPSFSLSLFFIYFFPIISSGSAEAVLPSSLPPPPPLPVLPPRSGAAACECHVAFCLFPFAAPAQTPPPARRGRGSGRSALSPLRAGARPSPSPRPVLPLSALGAAVKCGPFCDRRRPAECLPRAVRAVWKHTGWSAWPRSPALL